MANRILFIFVIIFSSTSCIEVNNSSESKSTTINKNGLTLYFSTYSQRFLKIEINDSIVYNSLAFTDSVFTYTDLMIQTKMKDTIGYKFKVNYSGCEHNFYLPAKGLDTLFIAEVGLFNVAHIEKKNPTRNREFAFYMSKNIANNCNAKIAADSVTLYDGLFLNNYPRRYYNTMKLTHTFSKKRYIEMYVEIFDNFTYFSIDTEKYDGVRVDFDNHLVITTNLDEEWKRRNHFD